MKKAPRYLFLGYGRFMKYLKMTRIVNLQGGLGTGKTLLSVAIAYQALKDGYVVNSTFNFPVCFAGVPFPRWTFAVMDEAAMAFEDRSSYKDKTLNTLSRDATVKLRKQGSYLVIPSFIGTDKRFRNGLRIWRIPFQNSLDKWLWKYTWELGPEEKEEQRIDVNYWTGRLFLVNPSAFWGMYPTNFFPWPKLTLDWLNYFIYGGYLNDKA